jgi:hypothetical protein
MAKTINLKASPRRRGRLTALAAGAAAAALAALPLSSAAFGGPIGPPAHDHLWGYEAGEVSTISEYAIDPVTSTTSFAVSCVPPRTENGRGIAHDPAATAVPAQPSIGAPAGAGGELLWYTRLGAVAFEGDGFIHRTTLPSSMPPCADRGAIPFHDGPGGSVQDDIGALDLHPVNAGLLAVAGYLPTGADGTGNGGFSIFYKVNKANGQIVGTCKMQFRGGGEGNDTLTVANLPGLGLVWLSDAGEPVTSPNNLAAFTDASVSGPPPPGVIPDCTIVADFPKFVPLTGIDYEPIPKPMSQPRQESLVATDILHFFDLDNPPFALPRLMGSTAPSAGLEDITLAACPSEDDDDNDGLSNENELRLLTLLGDPDSDDDGIPDGNDDGNGNGEDDEDEDDDDECPDPDKDDDGVDDEDEDD